MKIEGIDIANFGSFSGFKWDTVKDDGGKAMPFTEVNLLYGRNCSGKTTLSRILQAMETGELPPKFDNPQFSVRTNSSTVTQTDVAGVKREVRVFNRAYVDKHLGFLRDPNNNILPFAIVGGENKAIEAEIQAKTLELGSVDEKTGLLHQQAVDALAYTTARQVAADAAKDLDDLFINKANAEPGGIKHNRIYGDANYDKRELKRDIAVVVAGGDHRLSDAEATRQTQIAAQSALLPCEVKVEFLSNFPAIVATATELITRRIQPAEAITDLLNDAVLQAWVQEGMPLHRHQRDTCGFCQQKLPADLWHKLDAHFSEAANTLTKDIAACLELIQAERDALTRVQHVSKDKLYPAHHAELEKLQKDLTDNVALHRATVDLIAEVLRLRSQRIFDPQSPPSTPNYGNNVVTIGADINKLVDASNAATATLNDQKNVARRKLLLDEVAKFVVDINYVATAARNQDLADSAQALAEPLAELGRRVRTLQDAILVLRAQLHDEGAAAERANEFLRKHFGHNSLRFQPAKNVGGPVVKFDIMRGTEVAHNLSDGEASLVAFCHFLARLEDTSTKGTRPILWIDDPISSLDANHLFYLFSLIDTHLARPAPSPSGGDTYRYEQIFISTHNLEFLKFLRRLNTPNIQKRFYVVVKRDKGSVVEPMPNYLVNYATEINFLFGEVHTCVTPTNETEHLRTFWNFGNNLRRFLEAFLYFKYPFAGKVADNDFSQRVRKFFGDADGAFILRMANEGSHSGAFDRALQPYERDEISGAARIVLTALKKDKDQYDAFLLSLGKTCPL